MKDKSCPFFLLSATVHAIAFITIYQSKFCLGFSISSIPVGGITISHHNRRPFASTIFMSSDIHDSDNENEVKAPQDIVIAGAGIIGTSTAYYLSQNHPHIQSITLIDPTGSIAPAASGKAGGFLALDWNDYSPVGPLARRSFELHAALADGLGKEKIMYRRLTCASISVRDKPKRPSGKKLAGVEWASDVNTESDKSEVAVGFRPLGDEETIAQVHPKMLCDAMWEKLKEKKR